MSIEDNIKYIGITAKKNFTGSYKEDKDNNGDYIIIEKSDFNEIKNLIDEKNININELKNKMENIKSRCVREITNLQGVIKDKDNIINDNNDHIERLKKIATNRSNSEREIKNKKSHHGYIKLFEQERIINRIKKTIWRFETPYPNSLKLKYVKKNVVHDMNNKVIFFTTEINENDCLFTTGKKFWYVDIS